MSNWKLSLVILINTKENEKYGWLFFSPPQVNQRLMWCYPLLSRFLWILISRYLGKQIQQRLISKENMLEKRYLSGKSRSKTSVHTFQ